MMKKLIATRVLPFGLAPFAMAAAARGAQSMTSSAGSAALPAMHCQR